MDVGDESIDAKETKPSLLPATQSLVETLRDNPRMHFDCVFGDGPAVVIREMDRGCVALRETTTQPLCPQHDVGRTPIEGDIPVVDLSIGGAWSKHRGDVPIYYIAGEVDGELELITYEDRPFR